MRGMTLHCPVARAHHGRQRYRVFRPSLCPRMPRAQYRATSMATARPVSLNRGSADFPTCRRIGILPRSRKVQHSRRGVSRGSADFPLPSKTEAVSASRKPHTIVQTSLRRGPDYPTFTRIEARSFSLKAQMRRAIHPFSTTESPPW